MGPVAAGGARRTGKEIERKGEVREERVLSLSAPPADFLGRGRHAVGNIFPICWGAGFVSHCCLLLVHRGRSRRPTERLMFTHEGTRFRVILYPILAVFYTLLTVMDEKCGADPRPGGCGVLRPARRPSRLTVPPRLPDFHFYKNR